ncbi:MAG: hypothetical protein GY849_14545 [Deltaproteobacteria bacterium]|nr:hypothetical protein [Deltaproteobacteria bacterium]
MAGKKQRMGLRVILLMALISLGWTIIPGTSLAQVFIAAKKSKADYVGRGEALGKNGKGDVRLRLTLSERGKTLTDLEIRNIDAKRSVWDTIPGNGAWLMVVTQKGRRLSRSNGDIRIYLKSNREVFDLFIEDDGSVSKGRAHYRLTAFFSDGFRKEFVIGDAPYTERVKAQVYIAEEKSTADYVGQGERLLGNGTGDVHVRLVLGSRGKTVSGFEIQNMNGRFSLWDTFSGNNTWLMAVTRNGKILNRFNGEITIPLGSDREVFDLFMEDNGSVREGRTHYKLTVFFGDESRREFTVGPIRLAEAPRAQVHIAEEKAAADYVGRGEILRANGNGDVRLRMVLSARGRTLTGLEMRNINGQHAVWDTTPGNGIWLIALSQKGRILNSPDGAIGVYLGSGQEVFDLFVEDNGSVRKGRTHYKITALFSDDSKGEFAVRQAKGADATTAQVHIAEKKSASDYVGKGETLRANGKADARFQVILGAQGKTLTGLEIRSTKGKRSVWDTTPGNGAWLAAVTQKGLLLNSSSGEIRVSLVSSRDVFDLFVEDNGSIADGHTDYKLIASFSDGSKKEFPVGPAPRTETPKAQVHIAEKKSKADYVGRGEILKGNGSRDVRFRLVLRAKGNTLIGLEIRNMNGQESVWDTFPGNGAWLAAVTQKGRVLNSPSGEIGIYFRSRLEVFDIFVEDNGSVRDGRTHYKLTAFFSDGTRRELLVRYRHPMR